MDGPDFIYTKGPGMRRLTPNNATGWRQFAAAVATTLVLALAPIIMVQRHPFAPAIGGAIGALVLLLFVRSAIARARVTDLRKIGREWAEFQAWRKRNGRL